MKALSLFSGCLGFDLGIEQAGIEVLGYCDNDRKCQQTIKVNKTNPVVFDNVFDPKIATFARRNKIDLIFGGPPCQSFSTIGKMKFLSDPRGKAMLGFVTVIEKAKPAFFVMENVAGITSPRAASVLAEIQDRFKKSGYNTSWAVLNAVDFGSPQSRKRFVMIGNRGKAATPVFKTTDLRLVLQDAIADLDSDPGDCLAFSQSMASVLSQIPEGGDWRSLPKPIQDKAMGNANRKSGGLTAFYRRLAFNRPSPTLVTSPTHRGTTLCHPKHTRPLSVREYKRIQGIPDNWHVAGGLRDQYKQIGNAVPIPLGRAIGEAVVSMAS